MSALDPRYTRARDAAVRGEKDAASAYAELPEVLLPHLVANDIAVLTAMSGDLGTAMAELQRLTEGDTASWHSRYNLEQLRTFSPGRERGDASKPRQKIAIVSLLFNWPSSGGGTIHTAETGMFLGKAGYEVRHFYAQYDGWDVGVVREPTLCPAVPLRFSREQWTADSIRDRFRDALADFGPDHVIVTDSWNTKPLLCEAASEWPYVIRLAALECICPLNNVRLLFDGAKLTQCDGNQVGDFARCAGCLQAYGRYSGSLHAADRDLGGVSQPDYANRLTRAFANAKAVLAVNEEIANLVRPYSRRVEVVPSGFDPGRFPWVDASLRRRSPGPLRILFAGLVNEQMKGFDVQMRATELLRESRSDFEVLATSDPPGEIAPGVRLIGWQSQSELPAQIGDADLLVFPTIAQEALGRTAVEAMAMGVPVVASRIGGLRSTVTDGETGLLFTPGDPTDLARKIEWLLDRPEDRVRMGRNGRRRFEADFDWEVIVRRHYEPLFGPAVGVTAAETQECE